MRSIKIENLVFKESFETHSLNSHMSSRSARACGRCGLPMKHPTYTSENGEKAILTGVKIENETDFPLLTETNLKNALQSDEEGDVVMKADKTEILEEWQMAGFLYFYFDWPHESSFIESFYQDGKNYIRGTPLDKILPCKWLTVFWIKYGEHVHTAWTHVEGEGENSVIYLVVRKGLWKREGTNGPMQPVQEYKFY